MTKKDIIDYVLNSPWNSNPAVLNGMLDNFQSGDDKEEIELSATENKVYTPEEGKVYNKVTVNVPGPTETTLTITDTSVTTYDAPEGTVYTKVIINSLG